MLTEIIDKLVNVQMCFQRLSYDISGYRQGEYRRIKMDLSADPRTNERRSERGQMKYSDGHIIRTFAYILRHHAKIVSGAYKLDKVQYGTVTNPGRDFTEEELLKRANDTLLRHCEILSECVDNLPTEDDDD